MSLSQTKASAKRRSSALLPLRLTLLVACAAWLSRKALLPILLPFGPARRLAEIPTYGPVDLSNDLLMAKHGKLSKIFERLEPGQKPLMKGPETLFFDDDGIMYAATEEANLIRISDFQTDASGRITAKVTLVKSLGVGRPVTGKFLGNTLYIVDAVLGLTRVQNVFDPKSKVELLASTVQENGVATRINFADDIAVGPKSGMIYLTDATEIPPQRDALMNYDCLYSSKVEALRGPSGRLLQYNPATDEMTILARNLYFANGVAVAEDESYLVFVESLNSRVVKYYLTEEKRGTKEYLMNGYPSPAWFDGVDCAWKSLGAHSTYCYAIGFSSVVPAAKLIFKLPQPLQLLFRNLLMMVPPGLTPKPQPYAGIAIFDAENSKYLGLIQDPKGQDVKALTGVTFHGNKLYLGSLHNDYIAVYDLS